MVVWSQDSAESLARLRLAERSWLRHAPHIFFSDKNSSRSPRTTAIPSEGCHVGRQGRDWLAHTPADHKAMHSILLANRSAAGSFRFMVLIDDDTILVLPRLRRLLQRVDHTQPLYMGTRTGGRADCPATNDCCPSWQHACTKPLPVCAGTEPGTRLGAAGNASVCPLTNAGEVVEACAHCACPVSAHGHDAHGKTVYRLDRVRGHASIAPMVTYAYGGTGIILSAGLLNRISAGEWESCACKALCGSADFRVGSCVRTLSGAGLNMLPVRNQNALLRHLRLEPLIAT